MEFTINPLAVFVAAGSAFVVGGLWYSVLFAKPWQRAAGVTDAQLKTGMVRIFVGSFLLAALMSLVLAAFIGANGALFGSLAGLSVGVAWVGASLGMIALFERRSVVHWAINAGYAAVAYTGMGAILGAMQAA